MFTRATYRALATCYRMRDRLFAFPYTWDGQSLRLISRSQLTGFKIMTFVFIAQDVHLLLNLLRMVTGNIDVNKRQGLFIIAYTCWYFLVATFSFQMVLYRKEMSVYLEQLFELNQDFSLKYKVDANARVPKDYSALIIRLATSCILSGPPCFGFLMLWYPDDYHFFYRYLLPLTGRSWWVMGLMCAWEVYQVTVSWLVMQFCWFQLMLHCTSCRFWMEQLSWQVKAPVSKITRCEAMAMEDRISMYRKIQLLNSEYNRLNRWFFALGLKVATVVNDASTIYCFALMYNLLVLFMYICFSSLFFGFTSVIVVTYSMAGNMYETSRSFILSSYNYAAQGHVRYNRRCVKSFYPISIAVGNLYVFQRGTTIGIIAIVFNLSTNAILMTLDHQRNGA